MQPMKESVKMDNVCGINLENLDFNLVEAALQSIETNTLTPIIKEELKLKIQTKRLAAGKEELPKPVFKEPEKFQLTEEEEQRRDHRRERNRVAAAKCRNKRKYEAEHLKTQLAEEQLKNYSLKRKLEQLEKEKQEIMKKLKLQNDVIAQPTSTARSPFRSQTPLRTHSPSPTPSPSPGLQHASPSPVQQMPSLSLLMQEPTSPISHSVSPVPHSPSPTPSPLPVLQHASPSPGQQMPSLSLLMQEPTSPILHSVSPVPQSPSLSVSPVAPSAFSPVSPSSFQLSVSHVATSPPPNSVSPVPASLLPSISLAQPFEPPALFGTLQQDHRQDYRDLPSTSSGIYEHELIPRRFSEDTPRNLGANSHQTRRFSSDACSYDYTYYSHQDMAGKANPVDINTLGDHLKTEPTLHIHSDNQTNLPYDEDFDVLSEEEFFRFENETIPFEQYQKGIHYSKTFSQERSDCMVTTDGIKVAEPKTNTDQDYCKGVTKEKLEQEENLVIDNYVLQLVPVFEDEAMVPECNQEDSFHGQPGPASPTFY